MQEQVSLGSSSVSASIIEESIASTPGQSPHWTPNTKLATQAAHNNDNSRILAMENPRGCLRVARLPAVANGRAAHTGLSTSMPASAIPPRIQTSAGPLQTVKYDACVPSDSPFGSPAAATHSLLLDELSPAEPTLGSMTHTPAAGSTSSTHSPSISRALSLRPSLQPPTVGAASSRSSDNGTPPVQLIEGGQWRYYLFFVIKALLIAGTIGMVVVNCSLGATGEKRQQISAWKLSVAGQTCQINPKIDSWWVILVGMGAAQFLWAAGASVRYAVTGWFPRNSSEVYLLQLPVSTISLVSAGAGLAGGGYLLLMLSWFVVSLMSGFAVVSGLLTGVPGLFDSPEAEAHPPSSTGPALAPSSVSLDSSHDPHSALQLKQIVVGGSDVTGIENGTAQRALSGSPKRSQPARPEPPANTEAARIVENPYSVTVQQYGRFYTALLLLYEFNKISDIATALILGVGDPLRVSFFVLGTLSLVHVQVTFYWLVGTRNVDTAVVDLYRGFGDVVLDTPMLCIEFYAIVAGVIEEANFTLFVVSIVLKSLSTLSHVYTLYKDIKLFIESRSREQLKRMTKRIRRSWAKSPRGARPARVACVAVTRPASPFPNGSGSPDAKARPYRIAASPMAQYRSKALRGAPGGSLSPMRGVHSVFSRAPSSTSTTQSPAYKALPPLHRGIPAAALRSKLDVAGALEGADPVKEENA